MNQTAEANSIQNCTISGTQDDCISGNSPAVGYLVTPTTPPELTCLLAQPNTQLVSVGSQVYFVDPVKGAPITDPASGQTAIQILTINSEGNPASAEADEDISIIDNEIDETPRTGIWVMNIQSGQISNNLIRNFGYDPVLPKGSHLNPKFDVTVADFQKPLVVQSSTVAIGGN